jgi:hypothetical protein
MRHGALEDLLVMPGDVQDIPRRLTRPRYPERLTRERVDRPARLVPGDIQVGHPDPPVLGDAHDTQVEQRVVQGAESQRVRYLVRPFLAVSADVRRLDPDRVTAERTIESAHRALIRIGAQNLFREPAAGGRRPA